MADGYILGVDAGGTRTRCIVAALNGAVLGRAEGAAANVAADRDGALNTLRSTTAEAIRRAGVKGLAEAACAGVAGFSALPEGYPEEMFHSVTPARIWVTHPDLHIAWAGGTAGQPGVVVIGGTGSVAYGRNAAGAEHRCGGWGYLLSDEGSAFWIGRAALMAVLLYHDGRGPATALTAPVAGAVGGDGPRAIIRYAYAEGRSSSEFARFAPLVTNAAAAGDPVAMEIMEEAGRHLAEIAVTTIRSLKLAEEPFPVAMVGGAFRARGRLLESFRAGVAAESPNAIVGPPRYVPVAGALILALQALGCPPDEATLARLDAALAADLA